MKIKPIIALAAAVLLLVSVAGCAKKYSAERDGKKLGEAVCDLKDADTAEDAKSALDEIENQLGDMSTKYTLFTAEDRADIDENLTDLQEHINQGNEVLAQQDIAVIRRSLENVRDDIGDTGQAAIDGFFQGLDDCENG